MTPNLTCPMSGADLVSLPDNRHQSSTDSNPYAYPYFHASDGSSHVTVYDLVVEFASHWTSGDVSEQRRLVRQIESECVASPKGLFWTDSCGDTALHRLAQMARYSGNVHFLIQIARCIIDSDITTVTAQNSWKETPLHQFAAHCGMPHRLEDFNVSYVLKKENAMLNFVSLLCEEGAANLSDYQECFPLHQAVALPQVQQEFFQSPMASREVVAFLQKQHADICDLLAKAAPLSLEKYNAEKQTPLMKALSTRQTTEKVVQKLLDRETSAPNKYLQHISWQVPRCYGEAEFKAIDELLGKLQPGFSLELSLNKSNAELKSLWEKTILVIRPLSNKLIHGLVLAEAPPCVVELALATLDPSSLHRELMDSDFSGLRPLDILLATAESKHQSKSCRSAVLNLLVRSCPALATIPDAKTGRLPLHTALSSKNFSKWEDTIQVLFRAYPTALSIRDTMDRLFPFQLAAANDADVGPIFELLRADPSVLFHF